jgi:hypothetical protein
MEKQAYTTGYSGGTRKMRQFVEGWLSKIV